jgi:uncharacterized membrane protein YdjX (TVP38/TMEM64 family)
MVSVSTAVKTTAAVAVCVTVALVDKKKLVLGLLSAMEKVESFGYVGPLMWALWLAVSQVFLIPTTGMEVLGGFAFGNSFGWWTAFWVCFLGKMAGMALVFFLARYFLGDWTRRTIIASSKILTAVFRAVEREGFRMVIIARFAPVPTGAKNYGLAAGTTCGFWTCFFASAIAGLPYSALAVSLGMTAVNALDILDGKVKLQMPSWYMVAGLVAAAPVAGYVLYAFKKAYKEVLEAESDSPEASHELEKLK